MVIVAAGQIEEEMMRESEARARMEQRQRSSGIGRTSSISFRAPQENFSINDFDIGKLYGLGSYSKVKRAKKKDTGCVYALKIMDKKFIIKENKASHVKMERIVLDQLDHRGIIRLFFTFQDSYSLYMALESCDGGELFDQITMKGCLSEDEARFYAAEIIDALEYIHGLGLIHRDIKPENLLLTADGHIKIADFGSVKPTMSSRITLPPDATNDNESTFVGTAAYVPPEVLNSSQVTSGNDLWALGCTLYQMLSGTSPFLDASDWRIFQRIAARDITFPDYFSDEASDLIDKLLDKDPSKRLGAGMDGYAALKFHPFFKGVDWKNLRESSPPKLAQESDADNGDGTHEGMLHHQNTVRDGTHEGMLHHQNTVRDHRNSGTAAAAAGSSSFDAYANRAKLASIDSFDSKWQEFLECGESIIMTSAVKKIQTLTSKKVQLILTDKPKLICVDPNNLGRHKVLFSGSANDLAVQVANSSNFKICMPMKIRSFEDPKERAWQWKKALEGLVKN